MREIKFRGMRKDIGWKYGYLTIIENAGSSIFPRKKLAIKPIDEKYITYGVDEESVGQYTGLKDKNGKEIYEGDIIIGSNPQWTLNGFRDCKKVEVEFISGGFYPFADNEDNMPYPDSERDCEVIGNIYENSELLREKK